MEEKFVRLKMSQQEKVLDLKQEV